MQNSFAELMYLISSLQVETDSVLENRFHNTLLVILSHQTQMSKAIQAVQQLQQKGLFSEKALRDVALDELVEKLASVAPFKRQIQKIKKLLQELDVHDLDLEQIANFSDEGLREFLVKVPGLGLEICDQILLYAYGRQTFPVDVSVHRVLLRHRMVALEDDYFSVQDYCLRHLPSDVYQIKTIQQNLQNLAKSHCKKTDPDCHTCPLQTLNGGPVFES